jgi:cyclophilin family peptidyl-prolyl cis-trans isomerase
MFIRSTLVLVISCAFLVSLFAGPSFGQKEEKAKNPIVVMETSMGKIKIELYPDKAPITVKNFLWYVNNKFYENLTFHRVIPDFMIQGGGFTKDLTKKEPNAPIVNEADNGLKNNKYTLAMARTGEVNSATSQFFINLKDNDFLNFTAKTPKGYGYAVFGKVIEGMETVDEIAGVKTTKKMGYDDVPVTPVVILKAYELQEKK